jgi:hypothetical protein
MYIGWRDAIGNTAGKGHSIESIAHFDLLCTTETSFYYVLTDTYVFLCLLDTMRSSQKDTERESYYTR